MISLAEAKDHILAQAKTFGTENISIEDALGRVLAQDIVADRDYPPFFRAAMDGYAFRFEDFDTKTTPFEVIKEIFAGENCTLELAKGQCFKIMTGAAVPTTATAIVRVEDSKTIANNRVELFSENIKYYQNISKKGEDALINDILIPQNSTIHQAQWATLAVVGCSQVEVYKLPKVAIISTGNEIKTVYQSVSEVQIRDSNSFTIRASLDKFKIKPTQICHVSDNEFELESSIKKCIDNDIILLSGGVSAGDADYVPAILHTLGVKKIFHKVAIKPGKPLWFGVSETNAIVFAFPGNPLSVQVACKIFLELFLHYCFEKKEKKPQKMTFSGTRIKTNSLDEFLPAKINQLGQIEILKFNGSGDISATLLADGIILHPISITQLASGDSVDFFLW